MGKKYGLFMLESLVVGSLMGCGARYVDWTGVDWSNIGGMALGAVFGLAGLGLLGLIAFTVGTGWILLLKGMLRRLRAQ
jgi:hypothetical protein